MTEKKHYTTPQIYRVELDQEQAILSACSLFAMSVAAGTGTNGCRSFLTCSMAPGADPNGCKRSSLALMYMGVTCHDQGVRPS